MKIAPSKESSKAQGKRMLTPPIPFERPEKRDRDKNEYVTFKLRSTPDNPKSATYEFSVAYFNGSESPEETLDFVRDVDRVLKGQNVTEGTAMFALMKRLLRGDAEAAFARASDSALTQNAEAYLFAVEALVEHMFPERSLILQKRCMRRYMRKPNGLTTKKYVARIVEISQKLAQFPPFQPNQQLSTDELLDICEFGIPPKWQRQMVLQDFDPMAGTLQDLVKFCSRMEAAETEEANSTKALSEKIPKRKRDDKTTAKWCPVCEMNNHTLQECKIVKKIKEERNQRRNDYQPNKRFKSNSWRREESLKSKEKFSKFSQEHINAMVTTGIEKAMKRFAKKTGYQRGGIRKNREEVDLTEEQESMNSDFKSLHVSSGSEDSSSEESSNSESSDSSDDE